MADGTLKVGTITTSSGSGTITVSDGVTLTGQSYPAFEAYLSGDQTISSGANTTVAFDTEVIDTNSAYDTSSYEFTVPANEAGKYFVYTHCYGTSQASAELADQTLRIQKDDGSGYSLYKDTQTDYTGNKIQADNIHLSAIMDLAVGDKIRVQININDSSGSPAIRARDKTSYFGAYKLGA